MGPFCASRPFRDGPSYATRLEGVALGWVDVTTVLLVRHGLTDANSSGVLAGWTPGVHLSDKGREQAQQLAERLAGVPVAGIVSSPLERCQETAAALAAERADTTVQIDERLGECRYGDWQG